MDVKDKTRFLSTTNAAKHFGVCSSTIRKWDTQGIVKSYRINGSLVGHRRIDILSFTGTIEKPTNATQFNTIESKTAQNNIELAKGAIYCRVSSSHQKDDLQRQIDSLQQLYPQFEVFKDIGSGINFKRYNFLKLIEKSIAGNFQQIVVAHKDRFSRFGFEFFEWLLLQYGTKLVVLDKQNHKSTEQELADDLLSIVHVFSCRQNGKRKYGTTKNKETDAKENIANRTSKN